MLLFCSTISCNGAAVREIRTKNKADALWKFMENKGVESLVKIGDGGIAGFGLHAKRNVSKGQQVLSIPKELWMDLDAAQASPIGNLVREFKPWVRLALFLLYERSKTPHSGWQAYIDMLPQTLDSPLFWSSEELEEIKGTQLLGSVQGYKEFLQREFSNVESVIKTRGDMFDPKLFTLEAFTWAFGILRSRTFPPLVGENVALVPLADLVNHGSTLINEDPSWETKSGGIFSRQEFLVLRAATNHKENEEVVMQYGRKKGNLQLAIDYGFVETSSNIRNKFTLTLQISPTDRFADDKIDIAEINGLASTAYFDIVDNQNPPDEMLAFLRLVAVAGSDAFLLEALFRNTVWDHLNAPVSRENEEAICKAVIDGCRATLEEYNNSTLEEDMNLLAQDGALSRRLRIAIVVRLGERQVLQELLCWFEARMANLDKLEYYAERRLRDLGLLDDRGNMTPWVFKS